MLKKEAILLILVSLYALQINAQSNTKKELRGKWWVTKEINLWDDTVSNTMVNLTSFRNWKYVDKKYKKAEGFYFMPNGTLVHQYKPSNYDRYRIKYWWTLKENVVQVFNDSGVKQFDLRVKSISSNELKLVIENRIKRDVDILRIEKSSYE